MSTQQPSSIYVRIIINPNAKYDWDKVYIQDSLGEAAVTLEDIVSDRLPPGKYLAQLDLEIKVLAWVSETQPDPTSANGKAAIAAGDS